MAARSSKVVRGLFERQADDGHDGAQMLARGQLGNHAAVFSMRDLGGDHGREDGDAILHHCRGGFIARCFDAENLALVWCDLDLSQFHYHLPESSIAQEPLQDRAGSRMLVLYRAEQRWEDRAFREFPQFLNAGDCLVLNDSKVFPSRLFGKRVGFSGVVEVLLVQPISEDAKTWTALVHPGRKMRTRERVVVRRRGSGGDRPRRVRRADAAVSL